MAKRFIYIVQSEMNSDDIYPFTERTVLCKEMEELTCIKWSRDTLDYHFNKLGEFEFNYRGYRLYKRELRVGKKRGGNTGFNKKTGN